MAIRNFLHRELQRLFEGDRSRLDRRLHGKLTTMLDAVDAATGPQDLSGAHGFHALKGDRKGTYAMSVTANWRLTFRFEAGHAVDVDFEDYH
jgi:proteic killer suppression protein